MAGLYDLHSLHKTPGALPVLVSMASFVKKRVDAVVAAKGRAWWDQYARPHHRWGCTLVLT